MSIFDLFKTAQPAASEQQAQPAQPGQPGQQVPSQQTVAANPTVPNPTNVPAQVDPTNPGAGAKSPLDSYGELWKTNTTQPPAGAAPMFESDPAKYMEAAQQLNFAQIIKPEQLQAIAAGGETATKAFAETMNLVSQAVFAQATHANTQMIEKALEAQRKQFASELPNLIKRQNVSEGLRTTNPAFSHPAAAPIISALEAQLTKSYPTATASEIQQHAQNYLTMFADLVKPTPQTAATADSEEIDWSVLLGG